MRESKLAVLLGQFEQFKIINNKDMGMDDKGRVRYQVQYGDFSRLFRL